MEQADLSGQRFNRWLVVRRSDRTRHWVCSCDCGTVRDVFVGNLRQGYSQSCGCLKDERTRIRNRTHGLSASREYKIWAGMKKRCYDPSCKSFEDYGKRGIAVCARWQGSFENFYADMGPRPSRRHSIERVNNDGPYSPDNCRWATQREQVNNTRRNHFIEWNGERLTLAQWAERAGIRPHALLHRLDRGWPLEQALRTGQLTDTTRRFHSTLTMSGETRCIAEWARITGIPDGTIRARIRGGWPVVDALTRPVNRIASQSA